MKILYFSDLHLNNQVEVDIIYSRLKKQAKENKVDLILNAGDFSNIYAPGMIEQFKGFAEIAPYIWVTGNHDFYRNTYSVPEEVDVQFTDLGSFVVVSGTLWTDFFGENKSEMEAYRLLNDRNYIYGWNSSEALKVFKKQFQDIQNLVQKHSDKKIILLTHHGISRKSISPQFQSSILNGSFVSDLDDWILNNPQIVLAVHGHVHQSFDYQLGQTRVVCHPRGYPGEENYFKYHGKIIEV